MVVRLKRVAFARSTYLPDDRSGLGSRVKIFGQYRNILDASMGGVFNRLKFEIIPERTALPVIRQVVESSEGDRVLCNECKKNEGDYRHFVLGIVAVADTGLSVNFIVRGHIES